MAAREEMEERDGHSAEGGMGETAVAQVMELLEGMAGTVETGEMLQSVHLEQSYSVQRMLQVARVVFLELAGLTARVALVVGEATGHLDKVQTAQPDLLRAEQLMTACLVVEV
jgi:hypothetical protein